MSQFLTSINPSSGTGNKTVTVTAPANDLEARSEVLTIAGSGISKTVRVNQASGQTQFHFYAWSPNGSNAIYWAVFDDQGVETGPPVQTYCDITLDIQGGEPYTLQNQYVKTDGHGEWTLGGARVSDGNITDAVLTPASGSGFTYVIHLNEDPTQ